MRKKNKRMRPSRSADKLVELVAALRTPQTGCVWSLKQSYKTTVPYTLEEAKELADAVARGDVTGLRDELGDLLYHIVFYARIAEERGDFDFGDVVKSVTTKMLRRHPHVFGNAKARTPRDVDRLWESIKADENSRTGTSARVQQGKPPFSRK